MRSIFIATTLKRFGIFEYGKVLFLFVLMSVCFASSLPAGQVGQPSPVDNMDFPDSQGVRNVVMTSGDACPTKEEIVQKTRTLQMPFIANNGQVDEQVKFYAKTFGGTVFVTKDGEIVYALPGSEKAEEGRLDAKCRIPKAGRVEPLCVRTRAGQHGETPQIGLNGLSGLNRLNGLDWCSLFNTQYSYLYSSNTVPRSIALKETIIGAKIAGITGEQPAVTTVNYFTGNDKSKWKTNVPTYDRVNLGEIYKGIELSLKAYGDNVEKLFCVKPGASPEFIKVQLDGGKSLRVNQNGQLEADTELGLVKFTRPIAYQEIVGKRVEVAVEYSIQGSGNEGTKSRGAGEQGGKGESETQDLKLETRNAKLTYGFTVASYDKTKDLIIDPLLASTYLGESSEDAGFFLTLDTSGNVYVTGYTWSPNFPTTSGAYDTSDNVGHEVFVSKLDGGLTSLLASTYLGGCGDDYGAFLALDTIGNVYVAGDTTSTDFPMTSGTYDTSHNGVRDVFVSKLDSGLTSLLASTFLGGSGVERGRSLAFDTSGNVYVAGYTYSTDFPTSGAYDTSDNVGLEVFVSKLDGGLTNLLASTYLGGSSDDLGYSLALDTSGNVYVAGATSSTDFPMTSGAYDTSHNGGDDVFVSKLDSGLTSLLASTYLGGSNTDWGYSFALDTIGNVYVTGYTSSTDFPMTSGAYDTSHNGGDDVFVSKLDSGLTSLLASTYLGGSSYDEGRSLTLDTSGNVYVTGDTLSTDFPMTSGTYDTSHNGDRDVFVSKLDSGLTSLLASTFLGGSSDEYGASLALDTSGNVYVTGLTHSTAFPTTSGAYDTSHNDGGVWYDVFVSKLDGNLSGPCTYTILPTSQNFNSSGGTGSVGITASSNVCSWTAISNEAWISVTSGDSGSGDGTVAYSVSANPSTSARTGTMTIAGETFTVSQDGIPCTYSLSSTSQSFISSGGVGSVGVTASSCCSWKAVSNAAWITVTSGVSGTGNGTVTYSVSANTSTNARTGTMTIAGRTFTITQGGISCTYSISPTSKSFSSGGGCCRVKVTASSSNCSWTAVSNAPWITVTSGGSGTGNGAVTYSVSANTNTSARTGTMTIAGRTFTVTQGGISCTYCISPTSKSFSRSGGGGSVTISASKSSCSWLAVSNAIWITVTSGGSGTGNGAVTYSVSANTNISARTGTMTIAGRTFTVTQKN